MSDVQRLETFLKISDSLRIPIQTDLKPVPENSWWAGKDQKSKKGLEKRLSGENPLLHSTIPDSFKLCHDNILGYLSTCYGRHYIAVIYPDMIWYSVLCELALLIKEDPEQWRDLFTDSKEKKELLVLLTDVTEEGVPLLNMRGFCQALSENIPGGLEDYLLPFTTTSERSSFAQQAAFMDAVSPYYNYSMYLCGIPELILAGSEEDWDRMKVACLSLQNKMTRSEKGSRWISGVLGVIEKFTGAFSNSGLTDWTEMFFLKECGSGSQQELRGWVLEIFQSIPNYALSDNFSTHISDVKYKVKWGSGDKAYVCKTGLFHSDLTSENILIPSFDYVICEDIP